jgi:ferritin
MEANKKKVNLNEVQSAMQYDILSPRTLSPEVAELLEERIGDEYTAHYFYRNASNWCADKAYINAAAFFAAEAATELAHAEKIQTYLVGWNIVPIIPPVKMIPTFTTLIDIVNKSYVLEYNLLTKYNTDSSMIFSIDLNTFDFLQEFRTIQNAAVAEYSDLLNAAQLINVENNFEVLYYEGKYFKG